MRKVFFVPRYIASLKYYERLFPLVRDLGADPAFLLFEDLGMLAYVTEKGLAYESVIPKSGRIPIISHVAAFDQVRSSIRTLLQRYPHARFVTEGRLPDTMKILIAEGADVSALQWCMHSSHADRQEISLLRTLQRMRGRDGTLLRALPRAVYFSILRLTFRMLDTLGSKAYVFSELPKRIGVFDDYSRDYFEEHGYVRDAIDVVGNYDAARAAAFARSLTPEKRRAERAALGLAEDTRCVMLLSTIFYAGNASVCMTKEENIVYYRSLIEDIRAAYGDEVQVLFKLHPREYGDASHYQDIAQVITDECDPEVLSLIGDLYIAHPVSVVNMAVRAAGAPSIIINFTPLTYMNDFAQPYGIRRIVTDRNEFREALLEAARGRAPHAFEAAGASDDFAGRLRSFLRL